MRRKKPEMKKKALKNIGSGHKTGQDQEEENVTEQETLFVCFNGWPGEAN